MIEHRAFASISAAHIALAFVGCTSEPSTSALKAYSSPVTGAPDAPACACTSSAPPSASSTPSTPSAAPSGTAAPPPPLPGASASPSGTPPPPPPKAPNEDVDVDYGCSGSFEITTAPFPGILRLVSDAGGTLTGSVTYRSSTLGDEAISGQCNRAGTSGTIEFTRLTTGEHYTGNVTFDGAGKVLSMTGSLTDPGQSFNWCWSATPSSRTTLPACRPTSCSGRFSITTAGFPGVLQMTSRGDGSWQGTVAYTDNPEEPMSGNCCESEGVELVNMFRTTGERYFGTITRTPGSISIAGTLADPSKCNLFTWSASSTL
jgi:hypothetical protein